MVRAGIVTINVSKMTYSLFAFFISLKILEILKALIKVVYDPMSNEVNKSTPMDKRVPTTIKKSKQFHPSLK